MTIIILLIGISLSVALLFLAGFIWSMKSGQFEDVDGPSVRMLMDEKREKKSKMDKSR